MARTKRKLPTIVVNQDDAVEQPSRGLSTEHPTDYLEGVADGGATTVGGGEGSTPTTLRRSRGPTKMKEIWKLPNNKKILVECNEHNQPLRDGGSKLAKFCGVIARNPRILFLSYESWSKVPTMTKVTAFDAIKQSSRRQLKIKHTTGSCSFAIVRDEMDTTVEGESVGEVNFFESTHTSKDETYRDEFAADIVKEARKLIEERSTSSADRLTIQREAMTDVRGKERPGRVRGMGLGPTPSQVFGSCASTSSRTSYPDVFKMQAKMQEEIDGLKDMIVSLISHQTRTLTIQYMELASEFHRLLVTHIHLGKISVGIKAMPSRFSRLCHC